jgi:hypothetical protein
LSWHQRAVTNPDGVGASCESDGVPGGRRRQVHGWAISRDRNAIGWTIGGTTRAMTTDIQAAYDKVISDRHARRQVWLGMLEKLVEQLSGSSGLGRKRIEWKGPDMRDGVKGRIGSLEDVIYWADHKEERAAVLLKLTLNEPSTEHDHKEDAVEVLVCITEDQIGGAFFKIRNKPVPSGNIDVVVREIAQVAVEEIKKKFSR